MGKTVSGALASEEVVIECLRGLTPAEQHQVAAFARAMLETHSLPLRQTLWEKIDERAAAVPSSIWERVPTDGAEQHDHYLYGSPKK